MMVTVARVGKSKRITLADMLIILIMGPWELMQSMLTQWSSNCMNTCNKFLMQPPH